MCTHKEVDVCVHHNNIVCLLYNVNIYHTIHVMFIVEMITVLVYNCIIMSLLNGSMIYISIIIYSRILETTQVAVIEYRLQRWFAIMLEVEIWHMKSRLLYSFTITFIYMYLCSHFLRYLSHFIYQHASCILL